MEAFMTVELIIEQHAAVQRGEIVRLTITGLGEVVVAQVAVYEDSLQVEREKANLAQAARKAVDRRTRENTGW